MKNWMLLAQTPRAGRYNHRFITAPDTAGPEARLQSLFKSARSHNEGAGYISAKEARLQATTQRTGEEILLLAWDDLAFLDASQKAVLQSWLAKKLPDLDKLVTQRIDWEQDGEPLIVQRLELAQWERELERDCARVFTGAEEQKIQRKQDQMKRKKLIITMVAAVILVVFAGITGSLSKSKQQDQEQEEKKYAFIKTLSDLNNRPDCAPEDKKDPCKFLEMRDQFETYERNQQFLGIMGLKEPALDTSKLNIFFPEKPNSIDELVNAQSKLRKYFNYAITALSEIDDKICNDPKKSDVTKVCELRGKTGEYHNISQEQIALPLFIYESDIKRAIFLAELASTLKLVLEESKAPIEKGDGFNELEKLCDDNAQYPPMLSGMRKKFCSE